MVVVGEDWRIDLERWLEPFLAGLSHPARRRMCPLYIAGLIGPGDRKSVQPIAARAGDVGYDQLHHFVAAGVWDSAPLEAALLKEADRLVGDETGFLVIDDTALPKKGQHSVGVAPQYASSLGKTSNCQSLVSVTLGAWVAESEVADMLGETERAHDGVSIGSYPFFREGRVGANFVVRSEDQALAERVAGELGGALGEAGFQTVSGGI